MEKERERYSKKLTYRKKDIRVDGTRHRKSDGEDRQINIRMDRAGHRGPVGLCTCIIPGGRGYKSCCRRVPLIQFFRRRWKVEALIEASISSGSGAI